MVKVRDEVKDKGLVVKLGERELNKIKRNIWQIKK